MGDNKDTVARRLRTVARQYPNYIAQLSKNANGDFIPSTYQDLYDEVKLVATRLHELGIERGDHIGLISDNRREWMPADLAVVSIGAADVPRGSDSTEDEIAYILGHADCTLAFAENTAQLEKILARKDDLEKIRRIICFEDIESSTRDGVAIQSYGSLLDEGRKAVEASPGFYETEVDKGTSEETVTLIYTSGTTGEPKGVMLSNRNYTFQIDRAYEHINIRAGETYLSVLPAWHSFERIIEYVIINTGAAIAYSKPVGSVLTSDMKKVKPHWTAAVPRLWEGIRSAVYRNAKSGSGVKRVMFRFLWVRARYTLTSSP